jgi:hypothetical protein
MGESARLGVRQLRGFFDLSQEVKRAKEANLRGIRAN